MGSGIKRRALAQAQTGAGAADGLETRPDPTDWQRAAPRVAAYLQAMGILDPGELARLCERVRVAAVARAAAAPLEDPVGAAIEETLALLDRWLAAELGTTGDADALCAARAAVLGGAVPGWGARWAGTGAESLAPAIRAAMLAPVPPPAPLPMEPSAIELPVRRLLRRIAALKRLLVGRSAPGLLGGRR